MYKPIRTPTKSKQTALLLLLASSLLLAACSGAGSSIEQSSTVQTATLRLPDYEKPEVVSYEVVDGFAITEGDIILGEVDAEGKLTDSPYEVDPNELGTSSFGVGDQKALWPNGVVPYTINANVPNATLYNIRDAIRYWELNTNISFVERNDQNSYVEFASGGGYSSFVGRIGNRQAITLGTECSRGNVIHEIGHAVGLFHEQTRRDRDRFIEIIEKNIQPGREGNFRIPTRATRTIGQYDYNSIMHYGANAFSRNGLPTIRALDGASIGQRVYLSGEDIRGINARYL